MGKHLIIASYDGIGSLYCGVGVTVQDTILSLSDIIDPNKTKISLAYIATDPSGSAFNEKRFHDSIKLTKNTNGHLIPLCNATAGFSEKDLWGNFLNWEYACASLATALNVTLNKKDDNVLMLHDTPFLLFHKFKKQIFQKMLRCFYMPRSSGLNYNFGDKEWRQKRIKLEREAFRAIHTDSNDSVLAIGKNFSHHLKNGYGLSFAKNDYLLNGLYFKRYQDLINKKFDVSKLGKFGIKINKKSKIIFSWGRASVAKGLKELLEAWQDIFEQLPDHYMIIQAPNNSGESDYFQKLKNYEKRLPRTFVINNFNPEIWQTILRTQNTDIVCIPSTMDPNPHTAIEAKLFSIGMNYVVISSNVDGVKDTYALNECLWVNPCRRKAFSNKILQAAKLDEKARHALNKANKESLSAYDYTKTLRTFLKQIKFL